MPIENLALIVFFILGLVTSATIYRLRVEHLRSERNYWRDAYIEERAQNPEQVNRG